MVRRRIVEIDETKCDGCGLCVPSCAEGAIRIVEGKARLVSDNFCDGLGACLGHCPQDAIRIVERDADPFDEDLVAASHPQSDGNGVSPTRPTDARTTPPAGMHVCPGAALRVVGPPQPAGARSEPAPAGPQNDRAPTAASALSHWPVQLRLVPPTAPFLDGAELLLVADCVPFALADFHRRFLSGRAVVVACPKLDDAQASLHRLADILDGANLRSLTVLHMEVPCCHGLLRLAAGARELAGSQVPLEAVTVALAGEVIGRETVPQSAWPSAGRSPCR